MTVGLSEELPFTIDCTPMESDPTTESKNVLISGNVELYPPVPKRMEPGATSLETEELCVRKRSTFLEFTVATSALRMISPAVLAEVPMGLAGPLSPLLAAAPQ